MPAEKTDTEPWIHPELSVQRPLLLAAAHGEELRAWAVAGYPHETCGLLVGREAIEGTRVVRVASARNVNAERARDRFTLDPEDLFRIENTARQEGLDVVGVWHSHPDHPARPSITDRDAAWEHYSYVIVRVTETGARELRSWRLVRGTFVEQPIVEAQS